MVKIRRSIIVKCPHHGDVMGTIITDTVTGDSHRECGLCGATFHFMMGFRRQKL